jgi:hypothetical protein
MVTERRHADRHGACAAGIMACPNCGADTAEAFWDGESTNFRCTACHFRWFMDLGYAVPVLDRGRRSGEEGTSIAAAVYQGRKARRVDPMDVHGP